MSRLVFALALTACSYQDDKPAENYIQLKRNTEFDGAKLRLFVTLADGTVVSVNTTDDVFQALPGVTPVPNHQARALTFFKETKGRHIGSPCPVELEPGRTGGLSRVWLVDAVPRPASA